MHFFWCENKGRLFLLIVLKRIVRVLIVSVVFVCVCGSCIVLIDFVDSENNSRLSF